MKKTVAALSSAAAALCACADGFDAVLSRKLGPTAQEISSWVTVFNSLEKLDAAADRAWLEMPDRTAYDRHRRELRGKMIAAMGGFPQRSALNAKTFAVRERDGYRIEQLVFESMPGVFVPANLFIPASDRFAPPYPAVVMSCGHSEEGKDSDGYLRACVLAVKAGFAALMYDPYEQGERRSSEISCTRDHNQIGLRSALLGGSMAQLRVWDGIRAVDYVMSRADIDAGRVGFMGQSGGGTLAALMSAVDLRLKATAPSCFLTTLTSLCEHMGPQDAEQNIFGQLAFGLNHTGYVLLSDAAVAVTAKYSDMFTYYGTCRLFRTVEAVSGKMGLSHRYSLNAAPGVHGWSEATEQSSVDWMRAHLRGEQGLLPFDTQKYAALDLGFDLAAVDQGLAKDERGCTPSKRTADLPGARGIGDILREHLAEAVAARRSERGLARAERVRALARVRLPSETGVRVKVLGEERVDGCSVTRLAFLYPDALALPAELILPSGGNPTSAVISVGRQGRAAAFADARSALDAGKAVLVADLTGLGSIGQGRYLFYKSKEFPEEGVSVMLYLMGESMIGRRATDLLVLGDWLRGRGFSELSVIAKNDVAIAAAHAYAASPGAFVSVEQIDPPMSWTEMLSADNDGKIVLHYTTIVNGALKYYDWPQLLH